MRKKTLCGIILFCLIFSLAFAGWDKKPEFRWQQFYRYDLRQHDHRSHTNRFSLAFNYKDKKDHPLFKFIPFFGFRRNIHCDLWERKELGAEIGKAIFPWFYIGEVIQHIWQKEDSRYYKLYEKRNYAESVSRMLFSRLLLNWRRLKLMGFILNEYTYDLGYGAGTRNEVAIGVIVPVGKNFETGVNWRHIDRIHYYDSDTVEAQANLVF